MSPTPVSNAGESARLNADVLAAGAVLWRKAGGRLEVLLVHRPKYDDWAWPKGKVEKGETLPECAIRELEEETGYRVTLGLPLPPARYTVGKKLSKHVEYWAAHVETEAPPRPANPKEIDKAVWLPIEDARNKLTRFSDREQLDRLEQAHQTGSLYGFPVIIVRHGKAFPRSKWHETEQLRPLLGLGTRQSLALTGLLDAWEPRRLISSPWKRCVATLKPYSASTGRNIKTIKWLSEKNNSNKPEKTKQALEKIIAKEQAVAICTHRPVLPTVFRTLASFAPTGLAEKLPSEDPYMNPGEILIAYFRPGPVPRIVEVERYRPIDT